MRLRTVLRALQIPTRSRASSSYATATAKTQTLDQNTSVSPTHSIYISASTNPYFNLSLEDWLFRKSCLDQPLLLIYRDDPCVVIGRNQNPWKEVNLEAAKTRGVPWIRRRSGGGAVYHDLGNSNYSIHVPRSSFDRRATANVIVRALQSLHVPAEVNERNDICVDGYKISKTVCSAYKIANNRAYHHGTMLISAQLDTLGDLLRTKKETMIAKGVASVRSPVRNLNEFVSGIDHESFVQAVTASFRETYGIQEENAYVECRREVTEIPYIRDGFKELQVQSWEWKYGQTPEFEYSITKLFEWGEAKATVRSKHGIITACEVDCPGVDSKALDDLCRALEGERYGFLESVEGGALRPPLPPDIKELHMWLREETSN